jgi:hypothetical protein
MHRIQCIEYNAYNTMYRIQDNAYNAIHVYNVYNTMQRIQWREYNTYNTIQCI